MIPIHYKNVEILKDRITDVRDGHVLVFLDDVWTIGYKKPTFLHWITMKYDWMATGILYIATKSCTKIRDLIQISMPYDAVMDLPIGWKKKTEFYEFGGDMMIRRAVE